MTSTSHINTKYHFTLPALPSLHFTVINVHITLSAMHAGSHSIHTPRDESVPIRTFSLGFLVPTAAQYVGVSMAQPLVWVCWYARLLTPLCAGL